MNNEPVAWMRTNKQWRKEVSWVEKEGFDIPLYTHPANPKYDPETGEPLIDGYPLFSGLPPPPVKTLTDEEITEVLNDENIAEYHQGNWLVLPYAFARAILRKAQEK